MRDRTSASHVILETAKVGQADANRTDAAGDAQLHALAAALGRAAARELFVQTNKDALQLKGQPHAAVPERGR